MQVRARRPIRRLQVVVSGRDGGGLELEAGAIWEEEVRLGRGLGGGDMGASDELDMCVKSKRAQGLLGLGQLVE